jgi:hypothetical protein
MFFMINIMFQMMSIVSIDAIKNGGAKAIVMGVASGLRNC